MYSPAIADSLPTHTPLNSPHQVSAALAASMPPGRPLHLHLPPPSLPCPSCNPATPGAAALAAALPASRPPGLRPLWLRLEWNVINVDLLREELEGQRRERGLVTDIPRVGSRVNAYLYEANRRVYVVPMTVLKDYVVSECGLGNWRGSAGGAGWSPTFRGWVMPQ